MLLRNTHKVSVAYSPSVILLPDALSVVLDILVVRDDVLPRSNLVVIARDQDGQQEQEHEHPNYYLACDLSMAPRCFLTQQLRPRVLDLSLNCLCWNAGSVLQLIILRATDTAVS